MPVADVADNEPLLDLDELEVELQAVEDEVKELRSYGDKLRWLLQDPVQGSARRWARRDAMAGTVELRSWSLEELREMIASQLPEDQHWLADPVALRADGWRESEGIWTLDPELAQPLQLALEALDEAPA